jgi:putative RNA 2'-phosphotransferase
VGRDGGRTLTTSASLTDLSRVVSHALRHEPWLYDLELDEAGWVDVDQLIDALHRLDDRWANVDRSTLARMIAAGDKQRHELAGDQIRAIYGHSVPGRILRQPAKPPALLYHGTDPAVLADVLATGLRPMRRQYVHLSPDRVTAVQVGLRKARPCAVLRVDAGTASADGVAFYRGNPKVWLADGVPPQYLRVDSDAESEGLATSEPDGPAGDDHRRSR